MREFDYSSSRDDAFLRRPNHSVGVFPSRRASDRPPHQRDRTPHISTDSYQRSALPTMFAGSKEV
jgi:hypothetical protein